MLRTAALALALAVAVAVAVAAAAPAQHPLFTPADFSKDALDCKAMCSFCNDECLLPFVCPECVVCFVCKRLPDGGGGADHKTEQFAINPHG